MPPCLAQIIKSISRYTAYGINATKKERIIFSKKTSQLGLYS
jgi:hypothetical protein